MGKNIKVAIEEKINNNLIDTSSIDWGKETSFYNKEKTTQIINNITENEKKIHIIDSIIAHYKSTTKNQFAGYESYEETLSNLWLKEKLRSAIEGMDDVIKPTITSHIISQHKTLKPTSSFERHCNEIRENLTNRIKEQKAPTEEQKQTNNKSKGRPNQTFRDKILIDGKDELIEALNRMISRKIGKGVALIILGCIKNGLINKPTFTEVKNQFGYIGNRSGYNKYISNEKEFTDTEKEGIMEALKRFKS